MIQVLLLILGFALLVVSADKLVDGASAMGSKLGVSQLIIGLTVVAFGTSAPELVINVIAGSAESSGIAIGNIFGSSTSNILLILGVSSLIYPLYVHDNAVSKEIPFSLLAIGIVGLLVNERFLDTVSGGSLFLSRSDGMVLLGIFLIFVYYMFFSAKNGTTTTVEAQPDTPEMGWIRASVYVVGGLIGLILGGQWVVNGAVFIASFLGVSKALIGVTIVAIGTSLPELVTSAAAALKHNTDIAIGNVVGSNIFNITWILGVSATISPLAYDPSSNVDLFVTIGASIALFLAIFIGKKQILGKWEGGVFVTAYILYIAVSVIRELGYI